MSKIDRRLVCAALFACLLSPAARAEEVSIAITQAWIRATPGGSRVAGGNLAIENTGPVADKLLSASTAAARKIEIHEMAITDGVMTMRPVEGGLPIRSGTTVKFTPGGLHLMMIGLSAPLLRGDKVAVSLKFEKAGTIAVTFDVQAMGASAPGPVSSATEPATNAATKM